MGDMVTEKVSQDKILLYKQLSFFLFTKNSCDSAKYLVTPAKIFGYTSNNIWSIQKKIFSYYGKNICLLGKNILCIGAGAAGPV